MQSVSARIRLLGGFPSAIFRAGGVPAQATSIDSKLLLVVRVEGGADSTPDDRSATVHLFDHGEFKNLYLYRAPALLD